MAEAYDHRWRTVTRPRILLRAGGRFLTIYLARGGTRTRYSGAACCERCRRIDCMHSLSGKLRSELDIAHVVLKPGEEGHDADENLAALCRTCHTAYDKAEWSVKFRTYLERKKQERLDRLDGARPILTLAMKGDVYASDD